MGMMRAQDRERIATLAAARANQPASDGYRIGPDDELRITIPNLVTPNAPLALNRPTVAGPVPVSVAPVGEGTRVSAGGTITLPLLGSVQAGGRTPAELERQIAQQLVSQGLLNDPQVTIQVSDFRASTAAVIGSVMRPGTYPLTRPEATVADLIWAAGGPTPESGRVVDFVPAPGSTTEHANGVPIRIDLEVLLHPGDSTTTDLNPRVLAGDVISISPAGKVLVDGWVDKPGSYPVTRGLTVSGALAAAGGALFPANQSVVAVKRVYGPGDERTFLVDLEAVARGDAVDVPIADGDVVRPASHGARVVLWVMWTAVRDLVRVGGTVL